MSDWSDIVDAIVDDLTANVAGLADVEVHRYAPWSPENLQADGARHLSVFPLAEGEVAEVVAIGSASGSRRLTKTLAILIWEDSVTQAERQVADEDADRAWLQLHNDVRERFFRESALIMGGVNRLEYAGAVFGENAELVRWMQIQLAAETFKAFA